MFTFLKCFRQGGSWNQAQYPSSHCQLRSNGNRKCFVVVVVVVVVVAVAVVLIS